MKPIKQENLLVNSMKFVAKDLVGGILYWPVWWYSKGLLIFIKTSLEQLKKQEQKIGLRVWLANLLNPMYGQYDWQGRIISFFMRLAVMIIRSFVFLFWIFLIILALIIWIFMPLFAIYQLICFFIWI